MGSSQIDRQRPYYSDGGLHSELTEVRGSRDPRASCRRAWEAAIDNPKMVLLNPRSEDTASDTRLILVKGALQNKSVQVLPATTFTVGMRSIDLVLVSEPLRERSTLIIYNGVHCIAHGRSKS